MHAQRSLLGKPSQLVRGSVADLHRRHLRASDLGFHTRGCAQVTVCVSVYVYYIHLNVFMFFVPPA